MTWFLHPLGLLALLGVPAVVALHLFRRRFRPHPVSALFLWVDRDRSVVSGRRLERLHRSPSFWLEVLAALLLGLAFAGLRLPGTLEARHLVVVLDASASMGAVVDGEALRDRAVAEVRDRIEKLPRRSRVTLVQSGTRPRVLAGPAAFPGQALDVLGQFRPRAPRHDLTPAVALGLQLAGGGSVLLVSDHYAPDDWPKEVEVRSVGEPAPNVAFTHVARTRATEPGTDTEKVLLTVASFSANPVRTTLSLAAGNDVLASQPLELEPGQRRHLSFDVPPGAPILEARLPADALELDNQAWLAPPPPRTVALASTLPAELGRFLGLAAAGSDSRIDRWLAIVPDTVESDTATAHLVVSRTLPPDSSAWCLTLESTGEERQDLIGPFLLEKRHPLLDGLTLQGIVWSIEPDLVLDGAPLISAGNVPLLTEQRVGERLVFRMNLDARRSSLQRSPDWPILLANLVELRRAALPGPQRTTVQVGESFLYRAEGEATYVLEGPDGERREQLARGTLQLDGLEEPGPYRLLEGERVLAELAVTFADAAESDLRALRSGRRRAEVPLAHAAAGFTWVEIALLLAALGLVAADWVILRRAGSTGPSV